MFVQMIIGLKTLTGRKTISLNLAARGHITSYSVVIIHRDRHVDLAEG